jgi:sugar-specific transcriptional regulator TrmB
MSGLDVAGKLLEYGLTEPESRVYVYLAKRGLTPAGEIAKALDMQRGQTYNILRALQEKGIVETVASKPTKFSAIPLPKAVDILIQAHRQRQHLMETIKPELVSAWESTISEELEESEEERFQFLRGVDSIYRKATEIVGTGKNRISMIGSELALYHADRFGTLDLMKKISRRNVDVKVLAEITPRIQEIVSRMGKISTKSFQDYPPPHFLIVDEKQIIFLTKPLEAIDPKEAAAVWTNSPMLIRTMQHLFEDMWSSSRSVPGIITFEAEPRETSTKMKSQALRSVQDELARHYAGLGFDVKKNYEMAGDSGAAHVFSLALLQADEKPILIDVESSDGAISSVRVIEFFAKGLDLKGRVGDATLVVKPSLDKDAQKLAKFYQIRFVELGSKKYPYGNLIPTFRERASGD